MNLTETPEIVIWPEIHYVFVEKIGPFQQTAPQAWRELHELEPSIQTRWPITGHLSLYKIEPGKMTYRAGLSVETAPGKLPEGLQYALFPGGKYSRFVLTGPYSQLPMACGRVFEIVKQTRLQQRDDFCIEHYANNPKTTQEDQLITEILIPTV